MDAKIKELLTDFTGNEGASDEALLKAESSSGFSFPDDYKSFLAELNGGEGFVGEEYLILWKAEELGQFNLEYEVVKYAEGLFLFASNGGGEGFAFDIRDSSYPIVQVPFIGMTYGDARNVADNFNQFLERMNKSDGALF